MTEPPAFERRLGIRSSSKGATMIPPSPNIMLSGPQQLLRLFLPCHLDHQRRMLPAGPRLCSNALHSWPAPLSALDVYPLAVLRSASGTSF